jgi:hypothetical protein
MKYPIGLITHFTTEPWGDIIKKVSVDEPILDHLTHDQQAQPPLCSEKPPKNHTTNTLFKNSKTSSI